MEHITTMEAVKFVESCSYGMLAHSHELILLFLP
jgi:dihydroorotase